MAKVLKFPPIAPPAKTPHEKFGYNSHEEMVRDTWERVDKKKILRYGRLKVRMHEPLVGMLKDMTLTEQARSMTAPIYDLLFVLTAKGDKVICEGVNVAERPAE